jgi:hypothetical protein
LLAVLAALVVGNGVTWAVDSVAGTEHDEGFIGNGLLGVLFLLVVVALAALVSFGAWELGGLVLGLK